MRLPERAQLPPQQEVPGLPGRGPRLPFPAGWPGRLLILLAVVAVPLAILPVVALARYTTASSDYCLSCHAEGGDLDRSGRSLVHPDLKQVGCVECHARPGQIVFEGYVKGFMAEPERVSPNCLRCHAAIARADGDPGGDQQVYKYNFLDIRISHRRHLERGATCTTCHANVAHDLQVPQTNRPRMAACNQCHAVAESCAKCHLRPAPPGSPPLPAPVPLAGMADGRVLYMRTCSGCHGAQENWVTRANLRDPAFLQRRSDQQLYQDIAQGVGVMPGFGRRAGAEDGLTDDQIRAIIGYLRTAQGKPDVPDGPAIYQANCAACHGVGGDRVVDANLAAGEFVARLGRPALRLAVARGRGAMPAFARDQGGPLWPEEIAAAVEHVWALAGANGAAPVGATGPAQPVATPARAEPGAAPGPQPPREAAPSAAAGRPLYASYCAACHGANGRQLPTADLAAPKATTDAELARVTAAGSGGMPGFGPGQGPLSAEQVAAVVAYVKSFAAPPAAVAPANPTPPAPTATGAPSAPAPTPTPAQPPAATATPAPSPTPGAAPTRSAAPASQPAAGNAAAGASVYRTSCNACHPGGKQGVGPAVIGVPEAEVARVTLAGASGMPPTRLGEQQLADLLAYIRTLR